MSQAINSLRVDNRKPLLVSHWLWLLILCLVPVNVLAETLYVGDRLSLGLHQQADLSSPINDIVETGDKVSVLERQGHFARVKTTNGKSGWVQSSFLSTTAPDNKQVIVLQDKLAASEEKLSELTEQSETLASKLESVNQALDKSETALRQVTDEKARLQRVIDQEEPMVPAEELDRVKQESDKQVAELEAQIERIKQETQHLTSEQIDKMKQQQFELDRRLMLIQQIAQGEALEDLKTMPDNGIIHRGWIVFSIVTLIIGFAIGIGWYDFKQRRRHGGYRV